MKKILFSGSALLALLVVAWSNCSSANSGVADATRHLPVALTAAQRPDATHTVQAGVVEAGTYDPLPARTHGYVRTVFVAAGDYVQPGQLLVKLDNYTFVTAPHAGFLGAVEVVIGQHISDTTRVATLSHYRYLVVSLAPSKSLRQRLHPGDSVQVWAATDPGRAARGILRQRLPLAPTDSVLEVTLASRAPFRPGEAARVRLSIHP
jgi:multidrug efflux pump subunit AcrA (membrane-fusion protein)